MMKSILEIVVPYALRPKRFVSEGEVAFTDLASIGVEVMKQIEGSLKQGTFNYRRLPAVGCGGMQIASIQGAINEYYTGSNTIYFTWEKNPPYRVVVYIPTYLGVFIEEIRQVIEYKLRYPLYLLELKLYEANVVVTDHSDKIMIDDLGNVLYQSNENPYE